MRGKRGKVRADQRTARAWLMGFPEAGGARS